MSDLIELIAVPQKDQGGTVDDLAALAKVIDHHDDLTLVTNNDVFLSFVGPEEALNTIKIRFAEKILFEENHTLQMINPGPFGPTVQPSTNGALDLDKDEDDIVEL